MSGEDCLLHFLQKLCLCCVCSRVVVLGLSVNCLGTLCRCGGYGDCDACTVVWIACVYAEKV